MSNETIETITEAGIEVKLERRDPYGFIHLSIGDKELEGVYTDLALARIEATKAARDLVKEYKEV